MRSGVGESVHQSAGQTLLNRKNTQSIAYTMTTDDHDSITIRPIRPEQTYALRHEILWPDKPFDYIKLENDADGIHTGAFRGADLVAVISLFVDDEIARFRKFATRSDQQRQGIGTQLMHHIETEARQCGATRLWCDARLETASFYQRFGMEPTGEEFFKGNIPYVKFQKIL